MENVRTEWRGNNRYYAVGTCPGCGRECESKGMDSREFSHTGKWYWRDWICYTCRSSGWDRLKNMTWEQKVESGDYDIVEMFYGQYKEHYDVKKGLVNERGSRVEAGEYNPKTKRIKVLVPKGRLFRPTK